LCDSGALQRRSRSPTIASRDARVIRTSVTRGSCLTFLTNPTPCTATVPSTGTEPSSSSVTASRKAAENASIFPTSSSTTRRVSGVGRSAGTPTASSASREMP
jgi:hypothetical protein